ncbi:MAG: hypothetical protein J3Q66DRAFT_364084 [Benniella sp.]|nr:MAG: hypothetical protein J3Q66DRAFT_364084 [Benniella sp.]
MTDEAHMSENPPNVERLLRVRSVIFPVVMFLVFSSVLIHGITVPLLHLQYKYTKTLSRKREEGSHVVTRLPHINIGDDIVLRSAPGSGSIGMMEIGIGGGAEDLEQRMVGYDPPRSGGGLDHQRISNHRPLDYGNRNYKNALGNGSGYIGVPGMVDLSRTSTNNTRTLEDVVQEMKEAAKGKWSTKLAAGSDGGAGAVHPLTIVSVHCPAIALLSSGDGTGIPSNTTHSKSNDTAADHGRAKSSSKEIRPDTAIRIIHLPRLPSHHKESMTKTGRWNR